MSQRRPFSESAYARSRVLGVCCRCMVLFAEPKNELLLLQTDDVVIRHLFSYKLLPSSARPEDFTAEASKQSGELCPCCMDWLASLDFLHTLAENIVGIATSHPNFEASRCLQLILHFPALFDASRISVRTILTRVPEKIFPFPSFGELLYRLLEHLLARRPEGTELFLVEEGDTDVRVSISLCLQDELSLCLVMWPECFRDQVFKIARCQGLLPSQVEHTKNAIAAVSSSPQSLAVDQSTAVSLDNGPNSWNMTRSSSSSSNTDKSYPSSVSSKVQKRKYAEVESHDYETLDYDATMRRPSVASLLVPVSRKLIDHMLIWQRSLDESGLDALMHRIATYFNYRGGDSGMQISGYNNKYYSLHVSSGLTPVYLLGRYRKLARDVPQSPWEVGADDAGAERPSQDSSRSRSSSSRSSSDSSSNNSSSSSSNSRGSNSSSGGDGKDNSVRVRKGRNSVEEIICEAVRRLLGSGGSNQAGEEEGDVSGDSGMRVKMHSCGREDIDVRMLGNGRPFVLEVLDASRKPTSEALAAIRSHILSGCGMNALFDVEVTWLAEVPRNVWLGMQTAAEEKCKAYNCVVWVERPLSEQLLKSKIESLIQVKDNSVIDLDSNSGAGNESAVESATNTDLSPSMCMDDEGKPCLQIIQATPLRVLHRRSLLHRTRYIYSLRAIMLSKHFLLLTLVTSAGAYVKEFVHGELGRTNPSLASLLDCRTDIVQLDVTWLFDSFGDATWSGEGVAFKPLSSSSSSNRNSSSSNSVSQAGLGSSSSTRNSSSSYSSSSANGGGNISSVSAGSSAGAAAVPTAVVLARLKAGRRAMASIASLEVPRDCHPLADPSVLYATSASGDAAYYLRRVFEAGTNLSWGQLEAIVGSQRHVV